MVQSLNWSTILPIFEKTVYGYLTVEAVYPKVTVATAADGRFIIGKRISQQLNNDINKNLTASQAEELTEGIEVEDMQIAIKTWRKKYYIDDVDLRDRQYDTIDIVSKEMARSLTEIIDKDFFNSVSTSTGINTYAVATPWSNTTTSNPTDDVLEAKSLSMANRGRPEAIILNTTDYMNALKSDSVQAVFNVGGDIVKQGDIAPFVGLEVYTTPLVAQGEAYVMPKDTVYFYQREAIRTEVREAADRLGSFLFAEVRGAFNIVYPQTITKLTGL